MPEKTYLEWLKTKQLLWQRQPDFVSLACSGLAGGEQILWRQVERYREDIELLLGPQYSNEWGHEALIDRLRAHQQVPSGYDILPVSGASFALGLVCQTQLRQPGAIALVETPTYDPLMRVPAYFGATVTALPRRAPNRNAINVDELSARMTPATALVVLSSPHNPSGFAVSAEVMGSLVMAAKRVNRNVRFLVDETYLPIGTRPAAVIDPCIISISSLSKTYGLGALRCGWIIAQDGVMQSIRTGWLHMQNIGSKLTEAMAVVAIDHLDEYERHRQTVLDANRTVVASALARMTELLDVAVAPTASLCFPRLLRGSVDSFAELLEDRWHVSVAPGRFFGAPEHFRLGYGGATPDIEKGIDRLVRALRQYAG